MKNLKVLFFRFLFVFYTLIWLSGAVYSFILGIKNPEYFLITFLAIPYLYYCSLGFLAAFIIEGPLFGNDSPLTFPE